MNPYLEPHGFLGTGASLLADVTLLAYLLLIVPGMIVGFIFARRKRFRPYHKWTMATITIINWLLIAFLMIVAYRFDVIDNISSQPDNTRYLLPTLHAVLGLPAQLLATFLVFRMFYEDIQVARAKRRDDPNVSKYWFRHAKPFMRITLVLWLSTALLGVTSYLIRYGVAPAYAIGRGAPPPVVTEEVAPVHTPEVVATPEVVVTPEIGAPASTPEVGSPAVTPEAADVTPTRLPRRVTAVPRAVTTPETTPEVDQGG